MWVILTTICFWNTAMMGESAICWKDALLPLKYENETSCVLVMQQLSRDLGDDMNNRLVTMQMKCHLAEDYPDYKHEIDKLPLYTPNPNKEE